MDLDSVLVPEEPDLTTLFCYVLPELSWIYIIVVVQSQCEGSTLR